MTEAMVMASQGAGPEGDERAILLDHTAAMAEPAVSVEARRGFVVLQHPQLGGVHPPFPGVLDHDVEQVTPIPWPQFSGRTKIIWMWVTPGIADPSSPRAGVVHAMPRMLPSRSATKS